MLEYLRVVGAAPPPAPDPVLGPVETLLADYGRYLARERGLSVLTIERNVELVRPFLAERVVDGRLSLRFARGVVGLAGSS